METYTYKIAIQWIRGSDLTIIDDILDYIIYYSFCAHSNSENYIYIYTLSFQNRVIFRREGETRFRLAKPGFAKSTSHCTNAFSWLNVLDMIHTTTVRA